MSRKIFGHHHHPEDFILASAFTTIGHHTIAYEYAHRLLKINPDVDPNSLDLQLSRRASLKSSLRYDFNYERLDNPITPTKGYSFHSLNELAGFGGDVSFFKTTFGAQYHLPLPLGLFGGVDAKLGHLETFGRDSLQNDRFFLGTGFAPFRGFDKVGPTTGQKTFIGGESFWTARAHLGVPLRPEVQFHFFSSLGNLVRRLPGERFIKSAEKLGSDIRIVLGGGFVFPLPIGRIELNFNYPLLSRKTDVTSWFQISFSTHF
eukprot:TRINITY_DN3048_c0_g1_i2.p1 TRINITY_DN3048_c0_g1~~TRINITY_DN3048_c0_g1_i2.p1  ORF type:complete len:261 (-),score=47.76 TRINITY_DN3048_c0_g1_i2:60-842(-)